MVNKSRCHYRFFATDSVVGLMRICCKVNEAECYKQDDKMIAVGLLVVMFALVEVSFAQLLDPRCIGKGCPSDTECIIMSECQDKLHCKSTVICSPIGQTPNG
nr:hypothetical protein BgiMline_034916 [Biomphalaria glabrata]